ncbi:MAG: hypothetical protein IJ225_08900, partial [Solobacterium sp.]|nr:hypothetical protein [Solobacterium sp.]
FGIGNNIVINENFYIIKRTDFFITEHVHALLSNAFYHVQTVIYSYVFAGYSKQSGIQPSETI